MDESIESEDKCAIEEGVQGEKHVNIDEIPVDTLKPAIGESDQGAVRGEVVNNVHYMVTQASLDYSFRGRRLVVHAGNGEASSPLCGQVKTPCNMLGKEIPDYGGLCRWCARLMEKDS